MKEFMNNYFAREKLYCLKYRLETPTAPVIYKKNVWGNTYCEDINVIINNESEK